MKTIALKILGAEREPIDIVISPETTVQAILKEFGLDGYLLSAQGSTTYFSPEEAIDDQVQDGDVLYACVPVGGLY
jgi:hypothetical protein